MATAAPAKTTDTLPTVQQLADAEALRLATEKAGEEAAALAAALAAAQPPVEVKPQRKALVSACIADQVNPLTNQRITHGTPVIALFDRWIEIQVEAGVLVEVSM